MPILKKTWYADLFIEAMEKVDQLYPENMSVRKLAQVISNDRVIEQMVVEHHLQPPFEIMVSMIRRQTGPHTLLIYELKFVASN